MALNLLINQVIFYEAAFLIDGLLALYPMRVPSREKEKNPKIIKTLFS